jgi:fructokinase/2-dehydro-3-deoxygluconokinase
MSSRSGPVLVLGDANVDLLLHVPERGVGAERTVREPVVGAGGTAANTARGLATLGVPTGFIGAVGDDAFGRQTVDALARVGVDTSAVHVTREAATCQVIAMVEADGERSLVVWPTDGGALRWLRPADIPAARIEGAAWLHTTGMCLRDLPVRDTVLAAMAAARAAGVRVSIDLNLRIEVWGLDEERRAVTQQAIALADVVFGSGPEEIEPLARALRAGNAEADAEAEPDAIEAAARSLAAGSTAIVARLGRDGALACDASGQIVGSPGFDVPVRNIIGAGDAFNAGFIAALVEGRSLADGLRWGNGAAALHVARDKGASLPTREELEALLG